MTQQISGWSTQFQILLTKDSLLMLGEKNGSKVQTKRLVQHLKYWLCFFFNWPQWWDSGRDGMRFAWESAWEIQLIVIFQLNLRKLSPNCAGRPAMAAGPCGFSHCSRRSCLAKECLRCDPDPVAGLMSDQDQPCPRVSVCLCERHDKVSKR